MNLAAWLARTAAGQGARPALMIGETVVADYAAFYRAAAGLAGGLMREGIKPGDRVAVFAKNSPEYLIAFFAIWIAGGVIVPINAKLHGREAAWIVENAGASLALVSMDEGAALGAASDIRRITLGSDAFAAMSAGPPAGIIARAADDLAWLFYTSGTTGRPKGVRITFGMIMAASLSYATDVDSVTAEDAALYAAPMSHGAGFYIFVHVLAGARHVCPPSGGYDADEVLDLAARIGRVSMFMAPTMLRRLTDRAKARHLPGEGLRTIVYGGGPMYVADIVEAVEHFGPKFVQIYGQGEAPMAISALSRAEVADRAHPEWQARLASVGRAQAAVELCIGDDSGAALPPEEVGEIMVRGPLVMPGYWQNDEATAKAFRGDWLLTGDMGRMDAAGYLTLMDRSKDMIISGGTNIYPREVEEALLTHPDVHEASVVGRHSDEWGEDVVAFVVSTPGTSLDPAALDAHCLNMIARFKRPKAYFAIKALPKNNYGKVLKTELRTRLA